MTARAERPYSSPLRAEQAAATRDRIVDATVELLQDNDGSSFSMQDVADWAGVAVRTVYRAFPTKDDLLAGVLEAIRRAVRRGRRLAAHHPRGAAFERARGGPGGVRARAAVPGALRHRRRAGGAPGHGGRAVGLGRPSLHRRPRRDGRAAAAAGHFDAVPRHVVEVGPVAQGLRRARRRRSGRCGRLGAGRPDDRSTDGGEP